MDVQFICSFAISPIEYSIMSTVSTNNVSAQYYSVNGFLGSVTLTLLNDYLFNSTYVESFIQDGFLITKSSFNDDNFLLIDLETGVVRDINTINNYCGVSYDNGNVRSIACISPGFNRNVNYEGEVVKLGLDGKTIFYWDKKGTVKIASKTYGDLTNDKIWADDILIINGASYPFSDLSGVYPASDIDITGMLHKGINVINAKIEDVYGAMIGCSPLYVVVVGGSSIQPATNLENLPELVHDLITGKKKFNPEYFESGANAAGYCITSIADIISLIGIPKSPKNTIEFVLFSAKLTQYGFDIISLLKSFEPLHQDPGSKAVEKFENTPIIINSTQS